MKKVLFIPIGLFILGFTTWYCTKDDFRTPEIFAEESLSEREDGFVAEDIPVDEPFVYDLYVNFKEKAGEVKVTKDEQAVKIRFKAEPGWSMNDHYLEAGTPGQFQHWSEPKPERFTYRIHHREGDVQEYVFAIKMEYLERFRPMTGPGPFFVAFAVVTNMSYQSEAGVQTDFVWAGDRNFLGVKDGKYFVIPIDPAWDPAAVEVCRVDLKTYTQVEWGAEPDGFEMPAFLLYNGFEKLFGPGGEFGPYWLRVGCKGSYFELTSPEMITAYLPRTEGDILTKRPYPGVPRNAFSGEVTALALNVFFDSGFADFAPSNYQLKDMIVVNTKTDFDGWTVEEVLETANEVLGGCNETYTAKDLYTLVVLINKNYQNEGFPGNILNCPD